MRKVKLETCLQHHSVECACDLRPASRLKRTFVEAWLLHFLATTQCVSKAIELVEKAKLMP
jgi:hypothetical protein